MHDFLPQPGGIQHIALFYAAKAFIPLAGGLKADAADTADFAFGVAKLVDCHGFTVFGDGFVLAEVDAADQFSYNNKVNALVHDLLLERGGGSQLGPDFGGAVVAVDPHAGAEPQQTLFGPHGAGDAVPFGAAYRAQKNAVGS